MDLIKEKARVAQDIASHTGLHNAIFGEWRVGPTDEAVVSVPGALTVSEEANVVGSCLIETVGVLFQRRSVRCGEGPY